MVFIMSGKAKAEILDGLERIGEMAQHNLDLLVGIRARNDALEAVADAAQALTVAISYIHTPERDYIDVPQVALNVLNDALGVLEASDGTDEADSGD